MNFHLLIPRTVTFSSKMTVWVLPEVSKQVKTSFRAPAFSICPPGALKLFHLSQSPESTHAPVSHSPMTTPADVSLPEPFKCPSPVNSAEFFVWIYCLCLWAYYHLLLTSLTLWMSVVWLKERILHRLKKKRKKEKVLNPNVQTAHGAVPQADFLQTSGESAWGADWYHL